MLGIFGLNNITTEDHLKTLFSEYGVVEKVCLIYDKFTHSSKGFGFIYFDQLESAKKAKESMLGREIDGKQVRVDYSVTPAAHAYRGPQGTQTQQQHTGTQGERTTSTADLDRKDDRREERPQEEHQGGGGYEYGSQYENRYQARGETSPRDEQQETGARSPEKY